MDASPRFLVAYDYGMGGLWAVFPHESAAEIAAALPEVDFVFEDDLPDWMSAERFDEWWTNASQRPQTLSSGRFTEAVLADRAKGEQLVGTDRRVFEVEFGDAGRMERAWLRACSEPEIKARYPELRIQHGREPDWGTPERAARVAAMTTYDIEAEPTGLLERIVARRAAANS